STSVQLFDLKAGRLLKRWDFSPERGHVFSLSPSGKLIAARTESRLEVRKTATGEVVLSVEGQFGQPLAFSPDGNLLLAGQFEQLRIVGPQGVTSLPRVVKSVFIWDLRSGKKISTFAAHKAVHATFLKNGERIAIAYPDRISIFDTATGRMVADWPSGGKLGYQSEIVPSGD